MSRVWVLRVAVGAAATLLVVAGLTALRRSSGRQTTADRYTAIPGGAAEDLGRFDAYWNDRLTYPTGNFNPGWLRRAAAQDARVPRGVPARASGASRTPRSLGSSAVALGPAPEHMTGCSSCFDYTTTEGRINAMVVDPTTTTNGSIVAYAASVGGGVWKTTNCCSASTTWTVTTDDPLLASISIDTLAIDPNNDNTVYAGTGDLNYGSFSMGSQGILKSTDAGAHWTLLGSSVFGPAYAEPASQFPQYDAVGKVRVDPNNSKLKGTIVGLLPSGRTFHKYLSEFAEWVDPPLFKSFLRLDVSPAGVQIRCFAATGCGAQERNPPIEDEFTIAFDGSQG